MTFLYFLLITLKAKTFGPRPRTSIQPAHILLKAPSLCCHSRSFIYYLHPLRGEILHHLWSFKASNHLNFFAFQPALPLMDQCQQCDKIIFQAKLLLDPSQTLTHTGPWVPFVLRRLLLQTQTFAQLGAGGMDLLVTAFGGVFLGFMWFCTTFSLLKSLTQLVPLNQRCCREPYLF